MFKRLIAGIRSHREPAANSEAGIRQQDVRHEEVRILLDAQSAVLGRPCLSTTPNRRGLRTETGALLEQAFIDLAAALQPTLSVEVGAHEASFSERLKVRCPPLRAIAFEASPRVFDLHQARLRAPTIAVDYRHLAIGDESGVAELQMPTNPGGVPLDPGISSLLRRSHHRDGYEMARVPVATLDATLAGLDITRSVAWIDVEGAQHKVIAGGPAFFSRVLALYIEVERVTVWDSQYTDQELTQALAGFSLLPVMRDELASAQFNQVYIRDDNDVIDAAVPIASRYLGALEDMIQTAEAASAGTAR